MNTILIILSCILSGMGVGFALRKRLVLLKAADKVAAVSIYFLLFILGASLGADSSLVAELHTLGLTALCLTLFCSAGSVLFLLPAERFIPSSSPSEVQDESATKKAQSASLWGCIRILTCFSIGVLLASIQLLPLWLCDEGFAEYALWVLVFSVGIGLGSGFEAFAILGELRAKILLIPLLIIAGTLCGAAAASLALPHLFLQETLSVGAGLGYYSLSSIIIGKSGNAALASVALLSNLFRELLSIIGTPLLRRYLGPLSPIATAGAAAMDICLPVIARYSGSQYAVIAVFSGMALTLAVPFLVAFIVYW